MLKDGNIVADILLIDFLLGRLKLCLWENSYLVVCRASDLLLSGDTRHLLSTPLNVLFNFC